jgi:hypothetical protein
MDRPAARREGGAAPQNVAPDAPVAGDAARRAANTEWRAARIEAMAAVVLAIAAVATAWSAYQSTRWNGQMAEAYNEAGALRTESVRSTNEATQRIDVAVTLTASWVSAVLTNNQELADVLRARMPGPLTEAMNRWLGDWQFGQPLPAGDPFNDGGYVAPETAQAAALEKQAEARFHDGRDANQYSDNYVLTGVVFALALFFAGISSQFTRQEHALRLVYSATVLLAVGMLLLLLQPKSIGI